MHGFAHEMKTELRLGFFVARDVSQPYSKGMKNFVKRCSLLLVALAFLACFTSACRSTGTPDTSLEDLTEHIKEVSPTAP